MTSSNQKFVANVLGKWDLPLPTGKYSVGFHDFMTARDNGVFLRLLYPGHVDSSYPGHVDSSSENISTKYPPWYPSNDYKSGVTNVVPRGWKREVVKWVIRIFTGYHRIPIHASIPPIVTDEQGNKTKFPLILWSHGLSTCRSSYSHLTYQLASHGFIVASIEHRDATAFVTCIPSDDGTSMEWMPFRIFGLQESDMQERLKQIQIRLAEIDAAMDLLQKLNNGQPVQNYIPLHQLETRDNLPSADFVGLLDFETAMVAGHSYGGATSIFALEARPKLFRLALCFDAWMPIVRFVNQSQVKHPILFINSENFQSQDDWSKIEQLTSSYSSSYRPVYTIENFGHPDVTDLPLLLQPYPHFLITLLDTLAPLNSKVPEPVSAHSAVIALSLDFIKHQLPHIPIQKGDVFSSLGDIIVKKGIQRQDTSEIHN